MQSKAILLDELVKQVNHNLQVNNTGIADDDDDCSIDEDEFDAELSESNSTKHLLTVYLFKMKNIFYHACFNFVLKLEAAQKFLVLLVLFKKLLAYILKKKKGKNYDQSQKKFESYLKNCARHCS